MHNDLLLEHLPLVRNSYNNMKKIDVIELCNYYNSARGKFKVNSYENQLLSIKNNLFDIIFVF